MILVNYVKLALRSLFRQRLFTTINVVNLAIGIAAMVLVFTILDLLFYNFDRFHAKGDRLYYLQQETADMSPYPSSVVPALPVLLRDYPIIENGTRIIEVEENWFSYQNRETRRAVMHVDTGFFNVLTFPLQLGDAQTALRDPNALILSQPVAASLFGRSNPLGKIVQIDSNRTGIVRGVLMPVPKNSHLQPDVIAPVTNLATRNPAFITNWYNGVGRTVLLLRPGVIFSRLETHLPAFVRKYYDSHAQDRRLSLLPFSKMFSVQVGGLFGVMKIGISLLLVFILLIVSINFLNITTAVSMARQSEVAVRTVTGANRWQVAIPFATEASIVALLGSLGGLWLIQLVFPAFVTYFEVQNVLDPTAVFSPAVAGHVTIFVLSIVLVETLLVGLYPAWFLTRQPVSQALQGKTTNHPTRTPLRNGLLIVQFTLATVLITLALVMPTQNRFLRQRDVGFALDQLHVLELSDFQSPALAAARINTLVTQLSTDPDIVKLSITQQLLGGNQQSNNSFSAEGASSKLLFQQLTVDADLLPTYGLTLTEGNNFSGGLADETNNSVIINEAARRALGWSSAVGKRLTANGYTYSIIGVVRDFHYQNLQASLRPLILFNTNQPGLRNTLYVVMRLKPGHESQVLARIIPRFEQIATRRPLRSYRLRDEFDRSYWVVDKSQRFTSWMTCITVFLACTGVFGLSVLTVRQRTKEIGIRKVLGASLSSVVLLLTRSVLKWVGLAVLIALPMAWWSVESWLQTFPYRIDFPWWQLGMAGLLVVLIAWLTVSFQSIRAALVNPVKSLRSE